MRTAGRHTIDAFNAAAIDAETFGFSELNTFEQAPASEDRLARLRELVAASEFAWVSANVREGSRPEEVFAADEGAQRWIVRDVGGVRVGITGPLARYPAARIPAVPPGFEHEMRVLDPVAAMRDVVPRMQTAGAELVVVLSHLHHTGTLRVARSVEGIDVILGTHHGPPTRRGRKVGGEIVAVAGPDEMQALGQLDLTVAAGRVVDHAFTRHAVEPSPRSTATSSAPYRSTRVTHRTAENRTRGMPPRSLPQSTDVFGCVRAGGLVSGGLRRSSVWWRGGRVWRRVASASGEPSRVRRRP